MDLHFYEPKNINEAILFQEQLPKINNARFVYALEFNDLVYISIGKKVDKVIERLESDFNGYDYEFGRILWSKELGSNWIKVKKFIEKFFKEENNGGHFYKITLQDLISFSKVCSSNGTFRTDLKKDEIDLHSNLVNEKLFWMVESIVWSEKIKGNLVNGVSNKKSKYLITNYQVQYFFGLDTYSSKEVMNLVDKFGIKRFQTKNDASWKIQYRELMKMFRVIKLIERTIRIYADEQKN
ncbi:hypothetical protein FC70_GL000197 [Paucilactobacillus oligofermentans DSM 15707 = LMG 22743]|uniref:Uncharacterized protein n=1 Tax=Paucilactobacillus oligofermentans DSM 15707 = LMG 22743 TaxID=1423778 RepID=A0A0R1RL17_9LACO|nr:hypothetical protein [Paucilactobacillus oligofermentans]KRL57727.1 hypothetical protein FC70_GL000197 [Paucilactobacillus oligofermentans DSM 15707 = LMG 22743]CUS26827.1 Uncharacterized protein LACOL_1497 [Paucilactobacillus oligofermentans DSM 15707 = LMG 22743]